ncbi:hypothetical protein D3C78_1358640 [compost metagenome]
MIRPRTGLRTREKGCSGTDDGAIETFDDHPGVFKRQEAGIAKRRSVSRKCLEIGFAALGIQPDSHGPVGVFQQVMQGKRLERGHAHCFNAERQGKTTRSSNTDTDTGERPRPDRHGNAFDILERQLRLLQSPVDHGHQPFGMALADRFADLSEHPV